MEVAYFKNIKRPVILLKILEDMSLLVVDSDTTIRFFDRGTLGVNSGFKTGVKHERYKQSMVAFSDNGDYFSTISMDGKDAKLYNAKTKKAIVKVDRHHGEVSCVGIDPKNRYMFTCGDDGKVFAFDIKSGKLVFTLPIHVDTVNDIAFSQNSNWVATASYDRKISLFNLATMSPKDKLKSHSSAVMKVRFINKNRLISTDKNSSAIVWNIQTSKVISRLQGIHDDVSQIVTDANDKFLFIGTVLGYIILYDLETYEQLSRSYIKLKSSITALEFDAQKQQLIIGTECGDILFYDIFSGEDKLKKMLQDREFDAIQKKVEENPILAYTEVYQVVANLWDNTLSAAKIALQKNDKKRATELFAYFKDIPSKNKIIQKVMIEYKEYEKFMTLAKQGKLPLAYSLANAHPMYKDSKLYKSLEANWKKALVIAQKYALQPGTMEKAKAILAPYRGISEKTQHIQAVYTQGEVYKRFRTSIAQKDFVISFELVKQHPFLKEFPEYDTLMKYGDSLYIKFQKLTDEGEIHAASKLLNTLAHFSDFSEVVDEIKVEIDNKQKFYRAMEEEDIQTAYNMLAETEDLLNTEDGQKLQDEWNQVVTQANVFAAKGDVSNVQRVFEKYMTITSKYMALGTIFGWAYMVQLESALKAKKSQAELENGIKNYMLSFGIQDQIENFFNLFKKYYPDSKLNLEFLPKGSMSMWRPAMITESILD